MRYIVYTSLSNNQLKYIDKGRNMDVFLTEKIEEVALKDNKKVIYEHTDKFYRIFKLLSELFGENAFKRFKDDKFKGPILISAYEAIIPGIYNNIDYWETNMELLRMKVIKLYNQPQYENAIRRGVRPLDRMCQLIEFSRIWFSDENKNN